MRERSRDEEKQKMKASEVEEKYEKKPVAKTQITAPHLRRTRHGRPEKIISSETPVDANTSTIESERKELPEHLKVRRAPGRPRGRPQVHEFGKTETTSTMERSTGKRRGVGRPKKIIDNSTDTVEQRQQHSSLKRGRGRPKRPSDLQDMQNTPSENLLNPLSKDDEGSHSQGGSGDNIENGTSGLISGKATPMRRGPGRPKKSNHKKRRGRPPKTPQSAGVQSESLPLSDSKLYSLQRTRGRPKKYDSDKIEEEVVHPVEEKNIEISKVTSVKEPVPTVEDIKPEESLEVENYIRKPVFLSMHNNIYGKGEIGGKKLRVASWNLRGIPAGTNVNHIEEYINGSRADIFCFHDFKIEEREFIDRNLAKKFEKKFSLYLRCNKSDGTGDLILTKIKPQNIIEGMKIEKHDLEGSLIVLEFDRLYLVAVNFPSSSEKNLEWDADFIKLIQRLNSQKSTVIIGDMNVPRIKSESFEEEGLQKPEPTANEQQSLARLLNLGFVDTFRHFPQEEGKWTTVDEKSKTNYALVNKEALKFTTASLIVDSVQTGSQCPIELHLKL